jgi:hypothetical protein
MDIDLSTLFRTVGWSFVMRSRGSPLLVEGIGMHSGDVGFLH